VAALIKSLAIGFVKGVGISEEEGIVIIILFIINYTNKISIISIFSV
jgi:hypothetical protein